MRAYAYAFFRFYPALYLGACAVNGANTVKMTRFRVTEIIIMCIFPAIKTGTRISFRFLCLSLFWYALLCVHSSFVIKTRIRM